MGMTHSTPQQRTQQPPQPQLSPSVPSVTVFEKYEHPNISQGLCTQGCALNDIQAQPSHSPTQMS